MDRNPYEVPNATLDTDEFTADDSVVPESALKQIRNAWVAACISGALTLVFTLIAMAGTSLLGFTPFQLIDVVLIFGLAFGIYKKSRVCAVIMLAYFIISKIILIQQAGFAGSGGIIAIAFLYYYGYGVVGTFAYHKAINEAS